MRPSTVVLIGTTLLSASIQLGAQEGAGGMTANGREPAAASLARDLIGEPEGNPLAGAELDRETEAVSSLMRCPVCQGLSVADSPTTSALAMREEARDLLASGYSEDQVLAYFERSYGEFIRLSPKPEGFNLVVWMLPVVALLAGLLILVERLRRRESAATGAPKSTSEKAPTAAEAREMPSNLAAYADRVRREVGE